MGWYAAIVLYLLGASFACDAYKDTLEEQGSLPEGLSDKIIFWFIVAWWPVLELYHLIFERRE
jgi:hypothetical protein